MSTLATVKKFRLMIQNFIKTQKSPPKPHQVLAHLLSEYQTYGIAIIGNFFASITQSHLTFAEQLSVKLSHENCNVPELINNYLKKVKLDKKDVFLHY